MDKHEILGISTLTTNAIIDVLLIIALILFIAAALKYLFMGRTVKRTSDTSEQIHRKTEE